MKKALFDVQSLMNVVQADRPTRAGMPGDRLDDAIRPNVETCRPFSRSWHPR